MATNSTSFSNTPQASDDEYSFVEDDAALFGYNASYDYFTWDVMADDLGGKAKKLFSLTGDDASTTQELWDALKTKDGSTWEETEFGRIRINNGKIDYQLGETVNGVFIVRDVESLAGNEVINDSFTYAIQLGNGTLSYATVTVNISGVNDLASISAGANEDTSVVEAGGVANADLGNPAAGGTLTVSDVDSGEAGFQTPAAESLTGEYGTFTFNATTGAWTYALDQAKADVIPAGESEVETLTVTSLDGTASYDIVVNITGTNDAPTITAEVGSPTLADTAIADTFADITGSFDGNDVDSGASLVYGLAVGEDGVGNYGTLTVNADGTYTFVANAAAINALQSGSASDVFDVTVDDGLGGTATTTLTINVTGANDTPTDISLSGSSVDENAASAVIGTLSASDLDTGDTHSYTVSDSRFEVIGDQLKLKDGVSLDFEAEPSVDVVVTAEDAGGLSYNETFTIAVNDVNEAPTDLSLSGSSVDENAIGAVIGTLSASDPDAGDTHIYTVSDSRFEVVGDQLKLKDGVSLDFEAEPSVDVIVTADDAGGLSYNETFTIAVNDVNEAPTAVVLSNTVTSTPENGGAIKVADIAVTDDALGTNTLSLSGADASAFYISGNALYFSGGADFETKGAYNVTVNVNDASVGGTPDASTSFALSITDVVENFAPVAQNDKWFVSDSTLASLSAATALLGNDSDPNGDTFQITALSNDGITWVTDGSDGTLDNVINLDTSKGTLAINTVTGAISYSTDAQTSDTVDTFYYRIADNNASPMTDDGQVTIAVEDIGTGTAADTVDLSAQTYQVSYISSGNGGDNLTGGSGLDTFLGGAANDILVGGSGNDRIDGGSGDDQITGNAGNDSIDVSAGNDTVLYTSVLDSNDVLTGFDSNASGGQDVINLDALFDSYGALSGTRADHVSIVQSGSDTLVQVDTNNSVGTYEMTITLTNITASTVTLGADVLLGS